MSLLLASMLLAGGVNAEPVLRAPATMVFRAREVKLSAKEFGLVGLVLNAPGHFVTYDAVHRWAGWTTKPNPARVRSEIKKVNLKALEYGGATVLADVPRSRGIGLTKAKAADPRALANLLATTPIDAAGLLRLSEERYVQIGLPRAELLTALAAAAPGIERVDIYVLNYHSVNVIGASKRAHWHPVVRSRRCDGAL